MDRIAATIFFLFGSMSIAYADTWTLRKDGAIKEYKIKILDGVRLSSNCIANECKAKNSLKKKRIQIPNSPSSQGTMIPSAGAVCKKLGGSVYILNDPETKQEQFCLFDDDSLLSMTDYYRL